MSKRERETKSGKRCKTNVERFVPIGFRIPSSDVDTFKVVKVFESLLKLGPPNCTMCSAALDTYLVLSCGKIATAGSIVIDERNQEACALCVNCMGINNELAKTNLMSNRVIGDILVPTKVL